MKKKRILERKLTLVLLFSVLLLVPIVSARRKVQVTVYTVPDFGDFVQYDNSVEMPNGFIDVDVGYKFFWIYDGEIIGTAYQYVTGITKVGSGNDFSALHGYGVFYSTDTVKPGTISYMLGNIYRESDNTFWGGHLKVYGGTEYFDGLKGQGELNFEIFAFELFLDYNPWA